MPHFLPLRPALGAAAIALSVSLLLAACGDATGPSRVVDIQIKLASAGGPKYRIDTDGTPIIECDPTFRAVVSGGGSARWGEAKIRWFVGLDRTTPIDSVTIPASDVVASWQDDGLAQGDTLESGWQITAGIPFGAEFVYTYLPINAPAKTASVMVLCGPTLTTDMRPPTLGEPRLEPASGELNPGDTLRISYSAQADAGVFSTSIHLTGACDVFRQFSERMVPAMANTIQFVLPSTCMVGAQLGITLSAMDGGGRIASRTINPGFTIVDTRPPTATN